MNQPRLTTVVTDFCKEGASAENIQRLNKTLRRLSERDLWVYMAVRVHPGREYTLATVTISDKKFAVIFSDESMLKPDGKTSILSANINHLFDSVFASEEIAGIAINPFTPTCQVSVEKSLIQKALAS